MSRFCLDVVSLLLAATLVGEGWGSALVRGEEQHSWAGRTLLATSGRCVGLDLPQVRQEAELKARRQLAEELAGLARELSGRRLSPRELVQEQAWLLQQPGVDAQTAVSVDEKDYGPVAVQSIELRLPQAVLAAWSERLVQHRTNRIRVWLGAVGATLAAWLAGWGGLVGLDRLTEGYHRRLLVLVVLAVLGVGTTLGWIGVCGAV